MMMTMTIMMMMLQFHDSWKSLCEWLDAQEQKLRQLSTNTAKMKHDLEELQVAWIVPRLSSRIICKILFLCSVRSRVCTYADSKCDCVVSMAQHNVRCT